MRYGVLNAEATRSAPGKGWKLNRSNPRSLLICTRVPVAGLSPFGGSATRSFCWRRALARAGTPSSRRASAASRAATPPPAISTRVATSRLRFEVPAEDGAVPPRGKRSTH